MTPKKHNPNRSTPHFNPFQSVRLAMVLLILLMAIPRVYAFKQPIETDLALYSIIAHQLYEGRSLYSDLWEHKPPALFATVLLAQLAGGYGPGSILVLGLGSAVLTMIAVYFCASTRRNRQTGLWAAAFWAVVSADVLLEADQPNVEALMNPCFALAFALMLRAPGLVFDRNRWLAVGALFALASLYKHIAFFFACAMALAHIASPPEGRSRKQAVMEVVLMASVGFAAWGSLFGYYFSTGNFLDFWDTLFVFNFYYSGSILHNLGKGLLPSFLLPSQGIGIFPLVGVVLFGLGLCRRKPWTRTQTLFLAYVVATFIMVASPGKFFTHYYQLWLPVLVIGAAWSLDCIRIYAAERGYRPLQWVGPGVLVALILIQANYFRHSPEGWSQLKYRNRFLHMDLAAAKINRLLLPDETFYVWGFDPGLYFYTRRPPVTGITNYVPLLYGPLKNKLSNQVKSKLSENIPELFVVAPIEGKDSTLYQWVSNHYAPFPHQERFQPYEFYYLKGGALQSRLLESH